MQNSALPTLKHWNGADCASGQCGEPCTNPDPLGCIDLSPEFDVYREAPPS